MWDRATNLQVASKSRSIIHGVITQPDGVVWDLVCVYGDPNHNQNPAIRKQILEIIEDRGSVCVMGDFNAIANEDEKVGGDPVMNKNCRDFKNFLFEGGLLDLGFKGPAFMWTNKRNCANAIYERLDRVVATAGWLQLYP